MEPIIHYLKNGRNFGPVTVRDFLSLLDSQVLVPDDRVRIEGEAHWTTAQHVAEQIRQGRLSVPPPVSKRPSSGLPAGSHTVFTSAPPIPQAALPRDMAALVGSLCGQCGAGVSPGALFCKTCGTRLAPKRCAGCHKDNDADARFCEHCGTRLAGDGPD